MKTWITASYAALAVALTAGAADAQTSTPAAPAQTDPVVTDAPATEEPQPSDIVVTGTRRSDRTAVQSAVPIDVFDRTALDTQAPADMNGVLRNLVPSFNVQRFATRDGSAFVRPPTMRGLPPDEILVLVNGKRRHRSALVQLSGQSLAAGAQGVDLAQLPVIAIDRVEVLRDGAAAQYGSDAIAGVINYGLRKDRSGVTATARYGQYYPGDGENLQLAASVGLPLGSEGYLTISGEYVNGKQSKRNVRSANAFVLAQARPDLAPGIQDQIIGDPQIESGRVFVNAGIPLGNADLYAFGNYGKTHSEIDFTYRQPFVTPGSSPQVTANGSLTGPDRFGTGTATYPYASGVYETLYLDRLANGNYNANGRTFNLNSIFPSGFIPRFKGDVEDYSGVMGLKGSLGELKYDLSASFGQSQIDYHISNTVNPSFGPDSPTSFYIGRLRQRELNFNADFTYDVEIGLAKPVTIAFGGERRREAYLIGAGDTAAYATGLYGAQTVQRTNGTTFNVVQQVGSNGFPGYGPNSAVNNARRSLAVYLDLETDIVEALSVGGAVRYERFSDFGGTTNVKGTVRYEVSPAIALRGAASTGFRAPTPGQLFTTNVANAFIGLTPIERATYPSTSPAAQFFGAKPLKPESSVNYSAGLVLTPAPRLVATLDAYQIKVTDRIGLSGNFNITDAQRPALAALGVTNFATLNQVRYFTNAFATRTRGVDLVVNYVIPSDLGRFATTLAANYNRTKLASFDPTVITRERKGDIEEILPRVRGNITENLSDGPFGVMLRGNFYGEYTSFDLPANGGDQKFGSEVTVDVEVSYQLSKGIRLAAGAENLLNNYPDKNYRAFGLPNQTYFSFVDATNNGTRYSQEAPISYNGGFWYVRAGINF